MDIDPLSNVWFAKIFFHSAGCLFHFVNCFFCCEEAFELDIVPPFVDFFASVVCAFGISKKSLPRSISKSVFPKLSSRGTSLLFKSFLKVASFLHSLPRY